MWVSTRDNFVFFSWFFLQFVKTLIKCSVSGIKLGKLWAENIESVKNLKRTANIKYMEPIKFVGKNHLWILFAASTKKFVIRIQITKRPKKKKTQTKMVYVKFAGKLKQTLWWQAAEGQKQIANDETLPIINAILCYPIWRRFLPFFSSAIKFSLFSFLGAEKFLTPPPSKGWSRSRETENKLG